MNDENLIVLDTNVLVSGFLSAHGPPGRIVDWLRTGHIQLGLDDRIAAEYDEVLRRPELHLPKAEVNIVLHTIAEHAHNIVIEPGLAIQGLPDPDDAPFAECAQALKCPLVTGNLRHFPEEHLSPMLILSPRQYIDRLEDR